jgi:protein gp37
MSTATTPIQWTDRTWSPIRGCSRVSPGCDNCYAMNIGRRFSGPGLAYEGFVTLRKGKPDWTGKVSMLDAEHLAEPMSWRKPARVFISMSDLFHPALTNEEIAAVFGVAAAAPHHTFQFLTKRAARMREWFEWVAEAHEVRRCMGLAATKGAPWKRHVAYPPWPLPNAHLGVSAEDQQRADERIPHLLATPAVVRFVSAEPLLGPIDFEKVPLPDAYLRLSGVTGALQPTSEKDTEPDDYRYFTRKALKLDWVIVGGESGPGARPCDVAWIRSIVKQCGEAGAAVFVKQLGARPVLDEAVLAEWPDHVRFTGDSVGLGRVLLRDRKGGDPAEWPHGLNVRQFPEASP